MFQYVTLEDTVYLGFSTNLLSGAGADGATPLFDVREGGASSSGAPTLSGTPTLLTHANYLDGTYEVAVAATAGNGFSANKTYLVYVTLTIDSVTPGMCIGGFRTAPVPANATQFAGQTITAAAGVTMPATVASTTNITACTITTVTNLTNAATAGDFTATMKTSLNAATPAVTVSDKTGFALTSAYDFAKGTSAMTEAYAANGVAPTPIQALYAIMQYQSSLVISGTSYSVKKLDASTEAYEITLDDATTPTSALRL